MVDIRDLLALVALGMSPATLPAEEIDINIDIDIDIKIKESTTRLHICLYFHEYFSTGDVSLGLHRARILPQVFGSCCASAPAGRRRACR